MSTFHPAASLLANFTDTMSTISATRLFIYISCSHQDEDQQLSWHHTSHSLEIPRWTSSQHRELSGSFYLSSIYAVMYMCYQRDITVLGVWSIFALLIAYWVLSAYFIAVLDMRLLTSVYGIYVCVTRPAPAKSTPSWSTLMKSTLTKSTLAKSTSHGINSREINSCLLKWSAQYNCCHLLCKVVWVSGHWTRTLQ